MDPVMTRRSHMPDDYTLLLDELKAEVRGASLRAHRQVNTELLQLYWRIGQAILERQGAEGWGAKVIDQLARDLRAEFPDMTGLSRSNLHYMRKLAASWPLEPIVQRPVGQLPWGHLTVLLDKLSNREDRDWYAERAAAEGWSRGVLLDRIKAQLHLRVAAAPSNFPLQLAGDDSDLARQLVKDPYSFEFLGLRDAVAERDLEQALMDHLQRFLLELGHGFAFVGRQWHFTVGGDEFVIDLLFFNFVQNRFVVVELKVDKFQPAYTGQLGMYVAWIDANLRDHTSHAPTIGILLCANKNERVVRYSLAGSSAAMAVAEYSYEALPSLERAAVPPADDLVEALEHPVVDGRRTTIAEYLSSHPDVSA
jgi:predicted nuclease of restriction endonuclease-like (RecB) superfamily